MLILNVSVLVEVCWLDTDAELCMCTFTFYCCKNLKFCVFFRAAFTALSPKV